MNQLFHITLTYDCRNNRILLDNPYFFIIFVLLEHRGVRNK